MFLINLIKSMFLITSRKKPGPKSDPLCTNSKPAPHSRRLVSVLMVSILGLTIAFVSVFDPAYWQGNLEKRITSNLGSNPLLAQYDSASNKLTGAPKIDDSGAAVKPPPKVSGRISARSKKKKKKKSSGPKHLKLTLESDEEAEDRTLINVAGTGPAMEPQQLHVPTHVVLLPDNELLLIFRSHELGTGSSSIQTRRDFPSIAEEEDLRCLYEQLNVRVRISAIDRIDRGRGAVDTMIRCPIPGEYSRPGGGEYSPPPPGQQRQLASVSVIVRAGGNSDVEIPPWEDSDSRGGGMFPLEDSDSHGGGIFPPKLKDWRALVFEIWHTEEDVVLFAKGVNGRQGKNVDPGELECVYSSPSTTATKSSSSSSISSPLDSSSSSLDSSSLDSSSLDSSSLDSSSLDSSSLDSSSSSSSSSLDSSSSVAEDEDELAAVSTRVTESVQEVFRCEHPRGEELRKRLIGGPVTLRWRRPEGGGELMDSVVHYSPDFDHKIKIADSRSDIQIADSRSDIQIADPKDDSGAKIADAEDDFGDRIADSNYASTNATTTRTTMSGDRGTSAAICACTMVHNVAKFVKEWGAYHAHLGVAAFFFYDNNSGDGLEAALGWLSGRARAERYAWPWPKTQEAGLSHCALAMAARGASCEWALFTDVDEFVFIQPVRGARVAESKEAAEAAEAGAKPLRWLIDASINNNNNKEKEKEKEKERLGQISLSCRDFGPSGLVSHPGEGVTQGYTCRMAHEQRHKSLVKLAAVSRDLANVVHHFSLRPGFSAVRTPGSRAVINHYKFQAWPEFRHKFRRRVSAYVADWTERRNMASRDRAPGLGSRGVKPRDWESRFCDVVDTALRDYVRRVFANASSSSSSADSSSSSQLLPWQL